MGLPTSDTDVELWSDESKLVSLVLGVVLPLSSWIAIAPSLLRHEGRLLELCT